jgi:hypothetical protein
MAFFFKPLRGRCDRELMPAVVEGVVRSARRQAHRATRARPTTQMRAQRREARMTTMSGSMETMAEVEDDELDVGAAGVAAVVEWMRLAGVRMVW